MLIKVAFCFVIVLLYINTATATNYRIWCYTGFKYIIGQEEKEDAQECTSLIGLDNYCYKFTASASVEEVVKMGCSNAICMVSHFCLLLKINIFVCFYFYSDKSDFVVQIAVTSLCVFFQLETTAVKILN